MKQSEIERERISLNHFVFSTWKIINCHFYASILSVGFNLQAIEIRIQVKRQAQANSIPVIKHFQLKHQLSLMVLSLFLLLFLWYKRNCILFHFFPFFSCSFPASISSMSSDHDDGFVCLSQNSNTYNFTRLQQ